MRTELSFASLSTIETGLLAVLAVDAQTAKGPDAKPAPELLTGDAAVKDAAKAVYRESGWRGYWMGFVPCFLRAFPANAMALVAFEGVMRALPD